MQTFAYQNNSGTTGAVASPVSSAGLLTMDAPDGAATPGPDGWLSRAQRWTRWLGPLVSAAVLVAILFQLAKLNLHNMIAVFRDNASAQFSLMFLAAYFVAPVTDWVIFRRLWRMPPVGFLAALRKQVANALLPSYSGEVYFYAWARDRQDLVGARFGAIKDVAILSALVGNLTTLVLLIAVYTQFSSLLRAAHIGTQITVFAWSIGFVALSSAVMMIFRGRLFQLPRRDLFFVAFVVLVRIVANTLLLALLWHLVLPQIALGWWVLMATIKMLLSRLPFVPNQEGLFAGVAILLMGHDQPLTQLVAAIAIGTLVLHLIVGGVLAGLDFLRLGERKYA